jgi:DNA-binding SARP family transcriptional activator
VAGFEAHKLQALLGYLLLYREQPHPRERVSSLLWGDHTTAQSKKHLRHALWQLQGLLEPHVACTNGCLLCVESDWIGVNQGADLWLDVWAFEQTYDRLQATPGEALQDEGARALQAAIGVYRGDLLADLYDDWCLFERERLQNLYLAMLDKLMAYHEARGAYPACLACGARILRFDRASERTHRRLMRAHYSTGNRTAALRQYERCATALRQELGVKPGRRTQELYRRIRADALPGDVPSLAEQASSATPGDPPGAIRSLPEALRRFQHLHAALIDLHREVGRDIRAIEQALDGPSFTAPE